ncbi:hypothetical protein LTSERUB_3197 [Salmonella enterica subsp. enterica serovar Rubislaw str. A4-653]|uniref:Uncharacterized protein n=1 Tax=Salmonella enterica subsp. enterica serovar Rubislaw str. A4-653 TaxID=913081 RepID=G5QKI6_SALRU|nr:hypothetical protein LTSERUB_3197 [Salmonella enterica subsp. enterica serovar Rubislaw str. A4-653]
MFNSLSSKNFIVTLLLLLIINYSCRALTLFYQSIESL